MITKEQIDEFYAQSPIAMIGVSRNKKKFGYIAYTELKKKGYNLIAVNTYTDKIDDITCYRTIESLPAEVKAAVVMTQKKETLNVVQQLVQKGIKQIWLQQGCQSAEAIDYARKNYVNLIHGKCVLMFSEPVEGIHKFHRAIMKLFGRYPK